jgi:ATP-dependent Clp protease protease subunit
MNPNPPPQPPRPITLVFIGPIQNPATKNLRNACCAAVTNGARELQILFSSAGGAVDEGFALYNFLRALPLKLTMHAIGYVDSIALVVFLAGEERFCTQDSTFMFHDFSWGVPNGISQTRGQWADLHDSLDRSAIRSQDVLKLRTSFTDEDLKSFKLYEKTSIQGASFAKEKGIVDNVQDVTIPPGSLLANIDF